MEEKGWMRRVENNSVLLIGWRNFFPDAPVIAVRCQRFDLRPSAIWNSLLYMA
jgi:hypothetical protein